MYEVLVESAQRHCCWPGTKIEAYLVLSILMHAPSAGLIPSAKGVERPEQVWLGVKRARPHDIVAFDRCYRDWLQGLSYAEYAKEEIGWKCKIGRILGNYWCCPWFSLGLSLNLAKAFDSP
jgi:hypothetical protein